MKIYLHLTPLTQFIINYENTIIFNHGLIHDKSQFCPKSLDKNKHKP